jgi:two-component system NtrC family sensor kinase
VSRSNDEARRNGAAAHGLDPDLIHGIDAIVWELDPARWRFTFVSDGAERILGYPASRWLNEPGFWENVIIHPADRERALAFCHGAIERRRHHRFRYRARRSDGRTIWLKDVVRIVTDDTGAVSLLRGVMFDITARKRTELALRASEARHRRLVETAPYGICEVDMKGRFVQVNEAAAEVVGRSREDLIGMDFRAVLAEEELPGAEAAATAILTGASPTLEMETTVVRPSGERRLVSMRATAAERNGRIVGITGIGRDTTEEREREDALRRAERLAGLGTLIGGVAHELNNPLQAISAFAELLVVDIDDPALSTRAELIQREAERASRIVSSLRRLARDTQQAGERTLVDLNDIVKHVLQVRSYTLQTGNISVVEHLEPVLPPVLGSRSEIEQVLLNLIVNAEQALASLAAGPRTITIVTRRERGSVVVSVRDNGPGIPREQLGQIFDPFYTTKSPGEGTGLGLSLAHSIVAEHGGTLRASSSPGAGATFIMRLPDAEVSAAARETRTRMPAPPVRSLKVLIVDDESTIRDVLASFLRRRGHEVETAAEGSRALSLVRARAPDAMFDVILSDLRMPGLGGDELLRQLGVLDPTLQDRVVVMTGDAASEETVAILSDAGVPVIVKPFTLAELAILIENR